MTPEEFKESFKIDDTVICDRYGPFVIKYIGNNFFVGQNTIGAECWMPVKLSWVKVEPEKKPSEEINSMLSKRINSLVTMSKSTLINVDKFEMFIEWLDENWPKVVKK